MDADLMRGVAIVVADIDVAIRQNDWVALSNNTDGKRPPEDFQRVVEGFPDVLVAPPVSAYFEAEVEETDPGPPLRVRARFALWTAAGPSDLVTELDLRYKADLRFWYTDDVILFRTGGTSSG